MSAAMNAYGSSQSGNLVRLPSLCAHCGSNPPTTRMASIAYRKQFFLIASRTQTMQFDVPLCATCDQAIRSRRNVGMIITIVGGLIALVGIAWIVMGYSQLSAVPLTDSTQYLQQYYSLTLPGLITLVGGGVVLVGQAVGRTVFAKLTGKGLQYRNKAYRQAYEDLNR